jgi:hypothetical protein
LEEKAGTRSIRRNPNIVQPNVLLCYEKYNEQCIYRYVTLLYYKQRSLLYALTVAISREVFFEGYIT